MNISLYTRRTSPPLNIAQNSKGSRHLKFMFQFDRRTASSFFFFFFLGGGGGGGKDIIKAKLLRV